MNKTLITLASILCLQLIIAAACYFYNQPTDFEEQKQNLLALEAAQVNKLVITQADSTLTLINKHDVWQLDSVDKVPVAQEKVIDLINKLGAIKTVWPTTTTSTSHQRFKVANDNFEKQVSFYHDDTLQQQLVIGSSPSFKKVYARNSESDHVYTIDFNSYELTTDDQYWLNTSALAVNDVATFVTAQHTFNLMDNKWLLAAPSVIAEGQEINSEKLDTIRAAFATLSVTAKAETVPTEIKQLTVNNSQGEKFIYSFAKSDDKYYLKRDDIEPWFIISEQSYQHFENVNLDNLLTEKVASTAPVNPLEEVLPSLTTSD